MEKQNIRQIKPVIEIDKLKYWAGLNLICKKHYKEKGNRLYLTLLKKVSQLKI